MNTYFASPERTDKKTLAAEIDFVGKTPVISGLSRPLAIDGQRFWVVARRQVTNYERPMTQETITHECRSYEGVNIVKNGRNAQGQQQYWCK